MTVSIGYLIGAYLLGSLCTGWFLVRLFAGGDLRKLGSGTVGARNTGRILGAPGFVATLAGDFLKGSAVVLVGRALGLEPAWIAAGTAVVIAGHIWPAWLGFHGGKGIATLLGVLLVLDLRILVGLLVTWGLFAVVLRHFSLAGLVAIAVTPVAAVAAAQLPALHEQLAFALRALDGVVDAAALARWLPGVSTTEAVGLFAVAAVVLSAHASNIKDYLAQLAQKRAKVAPGPLPETGSPAEA